MYNLIPIDATSLKVELLVFTDYFAPFTLTWPQNT